MSDGWSQLAVGAVLAFLGWVFNDKLKSIKEDTSSVRSSVDAHEKRINKVEKKQEKWEGILIGKGCLDSHDYPCLSDDDSQPPTAPTSAHKHIAAKPRINGAA